MSPTWDDDPELREQLRAADPATSLAPADPAGVARLLEDAMSHDELTESRETGTHDRSPLTWVIAAAAAVVIVGVGAFVLLDRDGGADPGPAQAGPASGATGVTELSVPAEAAGGRCMVPSSEALAGSAEVAFDGTVDSVDGGTATLTPTHWYAGEPTGTVTVAAPSEDLQALIAAVDFQVGERYLVAGNADGSIMLCGFSDRYDPQLAGLYVEAFGE